MDGADLEMTHRAVVVFITAQDEKQAKVIASGLIEARLAACVNITSSVESIFWWQGKIDSSKEALLIIKTREALLDELIKKVKELHSYDVPEIIALPIIGGSKEYLKWLNDSTG